MIGPVRDALAATRLCRWWFLQLHVAFSNQPFVDMIECVSHAWSHERGLRNASSRLANFWVSLKPLFRSDDSSAPGFCFLLIKWRSFGQIAERSSHIGAVRRLRDQ